MISVEMDTAPADGQRKARRMAGAVLVDMDGTLLDTGPDMAAALNRLRVEQNREPLEYQLVRPHVSHGSIAVAKLGFPDVDAQHFEALRERFLTLYRERLCVHTRLFAGFDAVLTALARAGLPWGIVTNKAGWLTEPLLAQIQFPLAPAVVISGDSLPERKPHPRPLLVAAERLGVAPSDCLYLGDAKRDIDAAHAAGMIALGASFGYLGPDDQPETWGADAWLDRPQQLLEWVRLDGEVRG